MYLFVFSDNQVRQITDNLSVTDYIAMLSGLLRVYRAKIDGFVQIVIDNGKLCEVNVTEATIIQGEAGRLHHI